MVEARKTIEDDFKAAMEWLGPTFDDLACGVDWREGAERDLYEDRNPDIAMAAILYMLAFEDAM